MLTESDWESCNNPAPMVRSLPTERYQRELRLFAVACVRRVWQLLPDACRTAIDKSEAFALGHASVEDLAAAFDKADAVISAIWSGGRAPDALAFATQAAGDASATCPRTPATVLSASEEAASAVGCLAAGADDANYDAVFESARTAELAVQASLLRQFVAYPTNP